MLVALAVSAFAASPGDDLTTLPGSSATPSVSSGSRRETDAGRGATSPLKKEKKNDNTNKKKKKKKKIATESAAQAADSFEPNRFRVTWKQHPSFRRGSTFRLDVKAMVQEDAHGTSLESSNLETFDLRRNRIGVSGDLFKHVEFEVEREFLDNRSDGAPSTKTPWKDAYLNIDFLENAQIQAGRFKIPFGLDQLTPITRNDFVNRSLGATYLAPARDAGAMAHGRFFKRGLNYWAGVFAHDGDNARSSKMRGGDRTVAARVTGKPFRLLGHTTKGTDPTEPAFSRCSRCARWLNDIEVGTAYSLGSISDDSSEPNGLRGKTVMTEDTFFHSVFVKGQRRRWETDVDWKAGRASARGEYTWVSDERLQQGLGDDTLPEARARAWYVSGGWVVFDGSSKGPGGVPRFLTAGWGSLEVVSRYERLWFDSAGSASASVSYRNPRAENILPSGNHVLTLGVNWTLNRWLRLQLNGIRERVEDPERSPASDGGAFWSPVCRVQFVL